MGSPVWRWKRWKYLGTKGAQQAAIGPVWMYQGLKALCLIHFWSCEISLFSLLTLWGNKNGLPSMKVKGMEIFGDKSGWAGCKWSSLNVSGTESSLTHPFLKLRDFHFLWGNNGFLSMKVKKVEIFQNKSGLNGPVWMPKVLKNPLPILLFGVVRIPFPIICICLLGL